MGQKQQMHSCGEFSKIGLLKSMAQSTQPFQLPLRRRFIGVAGQNAVQRQFEGAVDAAVGGSVVLIENLGSDLRA